MPGVPAVPRRQPSLPLPRHRATWPLLAQAAVPVAQLQGGMVPTWLRNPLCCGCPRLSCCPGVTGMGSKWIFYLFLYSRTKRLFLLRPFFLMQLNASYFGNPESRNLFIKLRLLLTGGKPRLTS